jgi:hypothetical protein
MENKNEICTYCDKFAYTNYRDKNWNLHKLCVEHIDLIKDKDFLAKNTPHLSEISKSLS